MFSLRHLLDYLRRSKAGSEDFLLTETDMPRHVAIIMDGNSRWAAQRHLPANAGHREGAKALKRTVKAAKKAGIRELTVYAFSTENWRRPQDEVESLMAMFAELIENEVPELNDQDIRVSFVGRRAGISGNLVEKMSWAETLTENNASMTLYVAFNYGGRAEIFDAARSAAENGALTGPITDFAESDFKKYLYAPDMHDPELLIRTSGEQRVSNFLLWQCAYSELYFTNKLWPGFDEDDLLDALRDFGRRQRRYGAR